MNRKCIYVYSRKVKFLKELEKKYDLYFVSNKFKYATIYVNDTDFPKIKKELLNTKGITNVDIGQDELVKL